MLMLILGWMNTRVVVMININIDDDDDVDVDVVYR